MLHTATDYGLGWVLDLGPWMDLIVWILSVIVVIACFLKIFNTTHKGLWIGATLMAISASSWVVFHTAFQMFLVYALNFYTLTIYAIEVFSFGIGLIIWLIFLFVSGHADDKKDAAAHSNDEYAGEREDVIN